MASIFFFFFFAQTVNLRFYLFVYHGHHWYTVLVSDNSITWGLVVSVPASLL